MKDYDDEKRGRADLREAIYKDRIEFPQGKEILKFLIDSIDPDDPDYDFTLTP